MIIQCEQCRTKFRLDDEKVSDRGVKVRCAKCRHIFTVRKDAGQSATTEETTPDVVAPPVPAWNDTTDITSAATPVLADFGEMPAYIPHQPQVDSASGFSLDFVTPPDLEAPVESTTDDITFNIEDTQAPAVETTAPSVGFDFGEAAPPVLHGNESVDFNDFTLDTTAQTDSPPPDLGFIFDDTPPVPADNVDFSSLDLGETQPAVALSLPDDAVTSTQDDRPFRIDPPEGAVDSIVLPAAGETETPGITAEAASADEVPPLSISSRRRQSSAASVLIGIITVAVVGILGYMAYTFINDGPKALSMFSKAGLPAEEGKITVQNVSSYFIPNAVSGELLVITGNTQNNFVKPRAALQVKATLFGNAGQTITTKTAYAGNPLTREQLAVMPAEKIEATMINQFGDSLINLEVQPGKTIPFALVIINPPKEAKDFGIEAVGSTVAAGK